MCVCLHVYMSMSVCEYVCVRVCACVYTHNLQQLYRLEACECPSFYCSDFIMVKVKVNQSVHVLKCVSINALNFVIRNCKQ